MRSRSSSNTSATSKTSPPPEGSIQILVKISGGKTIPLNVRPDDTVSNVLDFLSVSINIPADARLLQSGKPLEPSSTVSSLSLTPTATLQLLSPLRGSVEPPDSTQEVNKEMTATQAQPSGTTSALTMDSATTSTSTTRTSTPVARKSNKPRCTKPGCKAVAQPIVGDCGFCQKRFCGKHRMLESHACTGLDDAKQADRDRNTARLEGDRTVMLRGL